MLRIPIQLAISQNCITRGQVTFSKIKKPIQYQVELLKAYAAENGIKINEHKNTSVDVLPKVKLSEENLIEVSGIRNRSVLSWKTNASVPAAKGYKRIWMLRNLKR